MRDLFLRGVAYTSTLLTQREALAYRDEALGNWVLPGGTVAVQAIVLARLRSL